jgi:hypothetical protein
MLVPSILVAEENSSEQSFEVHKLSFSLGTFSAFSEMVGFGVKALALSSALTPEEMELFRPEAEKVAAKWGVQLYFEPELMITDLFSPSITEGKHLFLIYRTGSDGTLDQYLGLKKRKEELIASDNYTREAREQISWEFGKLLSYPNSKITSLIEKTNAGK